MDTQITEMTIDSYLNCLREVFTKLADKSITNKSRLLVISEGKELVEGLNVEIDENIDYEYEGRKDTIYFIEGPNN